MFKIYTLKYSIKCHVKGIQVGSTASCTHEQPTGHGIKHPSQSQVSQKCIKVKGLGRSSVHICHLDIRDIRVSLE